MVIFLWNFQSVPLNAVQKLMWQHFKDNNANDLKSVFIVSSYDLFCNSNSNWWSTIDVRSRINCFRKFQFIMHFATFFCSLRSMLQFFCCLDCVRQVSHAWKVSSHSHVPHFTENRFCKARKNVFIVFRMNLHISLKKYK